MQQHGIRARGKRRFRVSTTRSRPGSSGGAESVEPQLYSSRGQPGLEGNITYIATEECWLGRVPCRFKQSEPVPNNLDPFLAYEVSPFPRLEARMHSMRRRGDIQRICFSHRSANTPDSLDNFRLCAVQPTVCLQSRAPPSPIHGVSLRSEEHTSELQSL